MPLLTVLLLGALALAMPLSISLSVVLMSLMPSHGLMSVGLPAVILGGILSLHLYYQSHYRDGVRRTCEEQA